MSTRCRTPSGEIQRDAADDLFQTIRASGVRPGELAGLVPALARAYDYAGDRARAREAMRRGGRPAGALKPVTVERPTMLTRDFAERFADEWIAAWSSHDLDRILAHTVMTSMSSPRIAAVVHEAGGVLRKKAVADYWRSALSNTPNLRFALNGIYLGADSLALHYQSARGPAVEVFFFDDDGLVRLASANYAMR